MPMTETSAKENLDQQLANNTAKMQEMVNQQYNVEITRSVALKFSCQGEDCAKRVSQALFAKGMKLLEHDPVKDGARFRIRVGVKRSLRDTVREDFTKDLATTAAAMNGTYDGWELLADEAAETAQSHAA